MYNILYQINPMCKEEHIWWIIRLTDEEQQILDYHTEEHIYETELYALFSDPPIVITRKLKCGECGAEFSVKAGIWKETDVK